MALVLMVALAQEEDTRRVPRNRLTTPRCNAFDLSDEDFISNFRITKELAFQLIQELNPFLEPKTTRKTALSTEMKVLCALNFFAFGCYQKKVGNDYLIQVSQSSVSNCIRQVSEAMTNNLLRKYVKFPDDQSTQNAIKDEFFEYCGVLGAIDCTHVAIVAPPDDGFHHEKNYVNRKGWHSINVQIVCDMNMKILNVVARFPGCSHDAFIWQACNLRKAFDYGRKIHGDGWLLGKYI
ncbi:Putative nuclease HARBI1 [Araneus ventricosus]|nr:Putative nuclease HARBI1 [Araneus ventricosus]